ncbi:MAG: phosphatidic acid phosphatase [Lachnospiraceae bacterium]|jgi:membrane-associated phospholipid phosphatase|nr:phosphatidic acid phosphatase [Lachnospiraceae bacterium]
MWKIIPKYSVVPLATMLIMNWITYFATRFFTTDMHHHVMATALDDMIPFTPWFVFIYLLAFAQWVGCYLLIARDSKQLCYRVCTGEIIAKGICLVAFIVFPTTILRPEVVGNGLAEQLTRLVYEMDAPDNLFPSIHCLESWACFRGCMRLEKMPKWFGYSMLVFSLLVFASTVFLKQHVVWDMIGAVAAVEIGFWIAKVSREERMGQWIERRLHGQ